MSWREEFPKEYDVPTAVTDKLEDISWHNDQCPSFVSKKVADTDDGHVARLWVDHVERDRREFPDNDRFIVADRDNSRLIFSSETDCDGAIAALLALDTKTE